MSADDIKDHVRRLISDAVAQGHPPKVTDSEALRRVAALLRARP